eukprot:UN12407
MTFRVFCFAILSFIKSFSCTKRIKSNVEYFSLNYFFLFFVSRIFRSIELIEFFVLCNDFSKRSASS